MEKEEILNESIKEEEEVIQPKSHKKIIISLVITGSILVISTVILLVGYFKFNWFKSEIQNINIKISRNVQEVKYFTETIIIDYKLGLTSGESDKKEITVKNNFLVVETDRKKMKNNDFLNTASLIILDVKVNFDNKENQGISFDIFSDEKIKEFKSNPDGTKYPMAIFSFYDNGTIAEINLPNNTNQTIARSMLNLIEKLIPKMSRNTTEDNNNGIKINIKKNKSINTLVENQSSREIENIKKSKFSRLIERDIENGKLTSVRTNSNISLETDTENQESTFGLKDYFCQEKSKIILKEIKKENEIIELIQMLSSYYNFTNSKSLLKSFEIKKNETKDYIVEDTEKQINIPSSTLRRLDFEFDKTFTVKTFNVLGIRGSIKIRIKINRLFGRFSDVFSSSTVQVIISTSQFEATFGKEIPVLFSKTFNTPELPIFEAIFPNFIFAGVGLHGQGSLTVKMELFQRVILAQIEFNGKIRAKAFIWANAWIAEISGGAWGTLVDAGVAGFFLQGNLIRQGSIGGGEVVVFIQGKIAQFTPAFYKEWKVFDGWKTNF